MRDLTLLFLHIIVTVFRIARPGGVRSVIAESVLSKHQLLILNRSRRRAPNLHVWDRLIAGFCSLWIRPNRFLRSAIAFKPATLLNFHRTLVQRKYRLLFSPKRRAKPGPKNLVYPETVITVTLHFRVDALGQRQFAFRHLMSPCSRAPLPPAV
jgi:hypothetical protein